MNKQWVGSILPQNLYEIDDLEFLENLYNQLLDKKTELGKINESGKFKKSAALNKIINFKKSILGHWYIVVFFFLEFVDL